MRHSTVSMFVAVMLCCAPASAQVNPLNDFSGGISVVSIDGDTAGTRHALVGWQASLSQRLQGTYTVVKKITPLSIVGDFGGQFQTTDDGSRLRMYEYVGGLRARAGSPQRRTSLFVHALIGGTTRSGDARAGTGLLMVYGGGFDVTTSPALGPAYDLGVRVQVDWLPSHANRTWAAKQFRISVGGIFVVRYWD